MAFDPFSAVASLGGSGLSAGLAAREAAKARAFQKKVLKNQVRWRVGDLRSAGLNPILAASSGLGGGGAPGGVQPSIPDFGQAAQAGVSGAKAGLEKQRNKSVIRATEAQADAASAKAQTEKTQQLSNTAQANLASNNAEISRINAELLSYARPQKIAEAEVWSDPARRKVLQDKMLMSGGIGNQAVGALGLLSGASGDDSLADPFRAGATAAKSAAKIASDKHKEFRRWLNKATSGKRRPKRNPGRFNPNRR